MTRRRERGVRRGGLAAESIRLLAALMLSVSVAAATEGGGGDHRDHSEDHQGRRESGALHGHEEEHEHELDHDRARRALMRGEIAPLEKVLEAARARIEGEFVGAELEREGGRWVYDLKFIDRAGRLRKIHVDAKTANILGPDALPRQDGLADQKAPSQ